MQKSLQGSFFEDIDINEILNDAIKGEVDNSTLLKKNIKHIRKRSNHKYKIAC